MKLYDPEELLQRAETLGRGGFCVDVRDIARQALDHLLPPQEMSTFDYSVKYRKFVAEDGHTLTDWKSDLTPYAKAAMDALDDPNIRAVVIPKPARSGGTVVAENFLLKTIEFGPFSGCLWYLAGPNEVASYGKRMFSPMFTHHPGAARKLLARPGSEGNTNTLKNFSGANVELAAISPKTTTNRQERFIVFDEPDSYPKDFRSSFLDTAFERGRMIKNLLKIFACSHPDQGWVGGISQAWLSSTKGIFVMPCAECDQWASPYPTKYWPDVPRFTLHYDKLPERSSIGDRMRKAAETAGLACPHCGTVLNEAQRQLMIDQIVDMHEGQTLDFSVGPIGERFENPIWGLWWHSFIVKQISLSELAEKLEAAREHYERTGSATQVKKLMIRTFGEAWESMSASGGLDAVSLKRRTAELAEDEERPVGYKMGEVPPGVKFATAAVDPGGKKFDVMLVGWDLQRRRYVLDRFTIRQRKHSDGVLRDIAPTKVQADWHVLIDQVIDRRLPFRDSPDRALPVALTVMDTGDGNGTPFAYEFARQMDNRRWGTWRKVRCIKGHTSDKAEILAGNPTMLSTDDEGKKIEPNITLQMVGAHKAKEDVLETLAIEDGTAGQWFFPTDFADSAFEEFFNEPMVDGKFVRNGPNEGLDLGAYAEAARQILEPDRETIKWGPAQMPLGRAWTEQDLPIWARPIDLESTPVMEVSLEKIEQPVKKQGYFERFDALNQ